MSQCWPLLLSDETLLPGQERVLPCDARTWRFLQIATGVAYWMKQGDARELQADELLVIAPQSGGGLRASQLTEVRLRYFCFDPSAIVGLFSLAERADIARGGAGGIHLFASHHAAADLVKQSPLLESGVARLTGRAMLLHAALLVLAELVPLREEHASSGSAARRLHRFIQDAPDASLLSLPPDEIAARCDCTQKHLNSLWRRELACNIRASQSELRLQLARDLIEHSDEKISDIARRLGYWNVSRFNAAFKRMFACTPTECRARLVSES